MVLPGQRGVPSVHFAQFQGQSEAELLQWLWRLLLNYLAEFARLYRETGKRQVGREVALGAGGAADGGTSPWAEPVFSHIRRWRAA